jgi:hypothetical protein
MNEPETTAVVAGDASATVAEAAKKPKARSAPKWETEVRDRLKAAIRRYSKPLADLSPATPTKATLAWGHRLPLRRPGL